MQICHLGQKTVPIYSRQMTLEGAKATLLGNLNPLDGEKLTVYRRIVSDNNTSLYCINYQ